jgi:hypothetical protein
MAPWTRSTADAGKLDIQRKGQAKMKLSHSKHSAGGIEQIDAAYYTKYGRRYPTIVPSILAPQARAATLRLTPREEGT